MATEPGEPLPTALLADERIASMPPRHCPWRNHPSPAFSMALKRALAMRVPVPKCTEVMRCVGSTPTTTMLALATWLPT